MKAFDAALMAALKAKTTALALCVRIVRADGETVQFAQIESDQLIIEDEVFPAAQGLSIATMPFELSGGSTRFDLYLAATDHGVIKPADIRDGLYDGAQIAVFLVDRNAPVSLENVLFVGALGQLTVTEQGFIVIECVGLLERAGGLISESYTPVCRADFGDERCKVDLEPLTQHVTVAAYDGYAIALDGLNDESTLGAKAVGSFTFTQSPEELSNITINGVVVTFSNGGDARYVAFDPGNLFVTVRNLRDFLKNSTNSALQAMTYVIGGASELEIAAKIIGAKGEYAIEASPTAHATLSGPTLTSGAIRAQGGFEFSAQPAAASTIAINGTAVTFGTDVAIAGTLDETLALLLGFLADSTDPGLALCSYAIDTGVLFVTAKIEGLTGNAYTLAAGAGSNAVASGATLTGGGGEALSDYFLNGQIIFRSGRLIDEAYEIQGNLGSTIFLFTPTEFAPDVGDDVDIIRGCDHSPFEDGCGRYGNILNYRGEPWAPGEMVEQELQWITPDYTIGDGSNPQGEDSVDWTYAPPAQPGDDASGEWPFYFSVSQASDERLPDPSQMDVE
jgi:hypothetical protein